jgi:hypothetical protein
MLQAATCPTFVFGQLRSGDDSSLACRADACSAIMSPGTSEAPDGEVSRFGCIYYGMGCSSLRTRIDMIDAAHHPATSPDGTSERRTSRMQARVDIAHSCAAHARKHCTVESASPRLSNTEKYVSSRCRTSCACAWRHLALWMLPLRNRHMSLGETSCAQAARGDGVDSSPQSVDLHRDQT